MSLSVSIHNIFSNFQTCSSVLPLEFRWGFSSTLQHAQPFLFWKNQARKSHFPKNFVIVGPISWLDAGPFLPGGAFEGPVVLGSVSECGRCGSGKVTKWLSSTRHQPPVHPGQSGPSSLVRGGGPVRGGSARGFGAAAVLSLGGRISCLRTQGPGSQPARVELRGCVL